MHRDKPTTNRLTYGKVSQLAKGRENRQNIFHLLNCLKQHSVYDMKQNKMLNFKAIRAVRKK
jgi:hypothetical protein